jgi:hypothetical protein
LLIIKITKDLKRKCGIESGTNTTIFKIFSPLQFGEKLTKFVTKYC